jgi:hypothetical protein
MLKHWGQRASYVNRHALPQAAFRGKVRCQNGMSMWVKGVNHEDEDYWSENRYAASAWFGDFVRRFLSFGPNRHETKKAKKEPPPLNTARMKSGPWINCKPGFLGRYEDRITDCSVQRQPT